MKTKSIITILLISIISVCFSQNCKYEKNEVDKFTQKMTKVTKKTKLIETFNSEGHIFLTREDDNFSITLNYRTSFSKSVTVGDGSELSFLLDNGEIITVKKSNGVYPIEKNKLMILSTVKTKTIRYHYTEKDGTYKYSDTDIKNGNAEDFMKMTLCVL